MGRGDGTGETQRIASAKQTGDPDRGRTRRNQQSARAVTIHFVHGGIESDIIEGDLAALPGEHLVERGPQRARDLMELGRFEEAEAQFKEAMRLNPREWDVLSSWGTLLARQKRMPDAIEKWKQAIKLNPESATPFNAWGNALYELGRNSEASKKYQLALQRDPDSEAIQANLRQALAKTQRAVPR